MANESNSLTFEDALARLESVVKELEDGRLPLEKSLELFAEGVKLSKICNDYLAAAEQRIAVLTMDENGELKLNEVKAPFLGEGEC